MTKEEIIDELLKGCRDYILTNFEETDELPYLKSCITYYSTFNKNKINNEDYDVLLKEMLKFLKVD